MVLEVVVSHSTDRSPRSFRPIFRKGSMYTLTGKLAAQVLPVVA